ncbi:MAG: glycine zipper 2TM domain-containing protein [Xanthomonadales bacterium]|nr:glycine zipper 2TM domain-containing protein [Xanthomonadales bacterium]
MKRMMIGLAAAAMFATVPAQADRATSYERGRVLAVTPIFRTVQVPETREICYEEEVRHRGRAAPTILGAIVGGAVGNQFGGGNGRRAMTVAGAALGAAIANDNSARRGRGHYETRCELVDEYREEERITGYRVEYEYNGQVYATRTQRDPGEYIDLRVSVSPVSP